MDEYRLPELPDVEPGSYRDRLGRVFYKNGKVLRWLTPPAAKEWKQLAASRFFQEAVQKGEIIKTTEAAEQTGLTGAVDGSMILEHERVPFISYPYEWCFSALKSAALLNLKLLSDALLEGFILRDSSAFNIQFIGNRPVFIDILSFQKYSGGETWAGYRQFCEMFLYPLMLQAYKEIGFHQILRGNIDGISPRDAAQIFSGRSRLKRGVFTHVYLQSKLSTKFAATGADIKKEIQDSGFSIGMIKRNVKALTSLVETLSWKPGRGEWNEYTKTWSYNSEDQSLRQKFVETQLSKRQWKQAWDLGSNIGHFSNLAAEHAAYVVSFDSDHASIEEQYNSNQSDKNNVLPLIMNVADSSPATGWRGRERKRIEERGSPDLILCLALIHHLVITANIPMKELIEWLAGFKSHVLIEFVYPEDAMVRSLLRRKEKIYWDYTEAEFLHALRARFTILDELKLNSVNRALYFAAPTE